LLPLEVCNYTQLLSDLFIDEYRAQIVKEKIFEVITPQLKFFNLAVFADSQVSLLQIYLSLIHPKNGKLKTLVEGIGDSIAIL
jgi:hypothetical protein